MAQKILFAFFSLFLVWIMIAGTSPEELLLGFFVSAVIAVISGREFIKGSVAAKLHPRRWAFFLVFIMIFLFEEIFSHLDLTQKILFNNVDSGVYSLKTKFRAPVPLTVLGNSITLTPGSLTLDVKGNQLVTYCLNDKSDRMTRIFETFLESVFR